MMIQVFIIAFVVSYLGSIPPGTINVTTMQLAVPQKNRTAIFFSIAASLVEFVYAGLTVRFQLFLNESPWIMDNFYIITAIAMIVLGIANLFATSNSRSIVAKIDTRARSGFKRGIILGLLNPLTMPFWLAVTAFLQTNNLISLNGSLFWFYLAGISSGTFILLMTILKLGSKFATIADNPFLVHKLPGLIFIGLGCYNLFIWGSTFS